MINNGEFAKRLKKVLEYYQLSASAFAEKIQVQRSSISHLLSGRNKPSLDFVLKVLENFKEVELYWLLKGKGVFPKSEKKEDFPATLFSKDKNPIPNKIISEKILESEKIQESLFSTQNLNSGEIEKIVIFYKNGTFKYYTEL